MPDCHPSVIDEGEILDSQELLLMTDDALCTVHKAITYFPCVLSTVLQKALTKINCRLPHSILTWLHFNEFRMSIPFNSWNINNTAQYISVCVCVYIYVGIENRINHFLIYYVNKCLNIQSFHSFILCFMCCTLMLHFLVLPPGWMISPH